MAVRRTAAATLTVANTAPQFPETRLAAEPGQVVDRAALGWATYFLCGYKGVFDALAAAGRPAPPPAGLEVLVDGRVPTGSGLSFSSALPLSYSPLGNAVWRIELRRCRYRATRKSRGERVHPNRRYGLRSALCQLSFSPQVCMYVCMYV